MAAGYFPRFCLRPHHDRSENVSQASPIKSDCAVSSAIHNTTTSSRRPRRRFRANSGFDAGGRGNGADALFTTAFSCDESSGTAAGPSIAR